MSNDLKLSKTFFFINCFFLLFEIMSVYIIRFIRFINFKNIKLLRRYTINVYNELPIVKIPYFTPKLIKNLKIYRFITATGVY